MNMRSSEGSRAVINAEESGQLDIAALKEWVTILETKVP